MLSLDGILSGTGGAGGVCIENMARDEIWWYSIWRLRGFGLQDSFGGSLDLFFLLPGNIRAHWPLFTLDPGS